MMLLVKALAGALMVVLISLVSATKNYFIAGLIPLFPLFALIAHIIVGQKGSFELKSTALFGLLAMIPYSAYLLSVYILAGKLSLFMNLVISTFVWFLFAGIIYLLWIKSGVY